MGSELANSKRLAALIGPTLVVLVITEWLNIDVFLNAAGPTFGPHVYLNGTLLFVAGLAIVRSHNLWVRGWPILITVVGWFALVAGFARMAAPIGAQSAGQSPVVLYTTFGVLIAIGAVLTFKGYARSGP